jgi:hypothetical protein
MSKTDYRLKGSVRYGKTICARQFESFRLDWEEEFLLSETSCEEKTLDLEVRMLKALQDARVVK